MKQKTKRNKLVVELKEGLGNQLFHYALAKALSVKTGSKVVLDDTFFYLYGRGHRKFGLNHYKTSIKTNCMLPKRYFILRMLSLLKQAVCRFLKKYFINNFAKEWQPSESLKNKISSSQDWLSKKYNSYKQTSGYAFYNEKDCNYWEEVFSQKNTYFSGWFQSVKYFDDIKPILYKDFELKGKLDKYSKKLLEEIKNTDSVSIHVRRGDYLELDYFNVLPLSYYQKAVDKIIQTANIKNPVFYVFSNDMDWAKENFKFGYKTVFVESDIKHDWCDLELMRNCKHNIIANSTFSWWGAYLNRNQNNLVVAPSPWFTKDPKNYNSIVPESWITIDVSNLN